MSKIAIYGKGGIGKSTIAANLSAALAETGRKVLQIGCDPKHDSTMLLLHRRIRTTVLDYMKEKNPEDYRLSDVLTEGYLGIGCVEAGGPKPGVGCAGRGIISMFELLGRFALDARYDTTIYDVLGDVVCGGFAVPIRREYADQIFIVTSGEFMALYAANNILRGIANYDGARRRIGGILFNRRNVAGEEERVRRFAAAVSLPVFAEIPRSDAFTRAEEAHMTVMEQGEAPKLMAVFRKMAAEIAAGAELYPAKPLSDEDLEDVILGAERRERMGETAAPAVGPAAETEIVPAEEPPADDLPEKGYYSKNVKYSEPLHGCAFNGALSSAVHLRGAVVLAHAPKSCAYISYQTVTSSGRRRLFERGSILPVNLMPGFVCTEMGESEIVFGGTDKLMETVRRVKAGHPKGVIVISSCPAGIIGDDVDEAESLSEPDLPVIAIKADGNMAGDYMQGTLMVYTTLARRLIRQDVEEDPRVVNIIGEKIVVTNTDENFELIRGYLARLDVSVNCRYLYNTSFDSLVNFKRAALNLYAYGDYTCQMLGRFFEDEFGAKIYRKGFPVGFDETVDWLREMGRIFDREEAAEEIIRREAADYERRVEALKPYLAGKKLMVVTFNYELDWVLKTALDVGMEIVKIGVLVYSQDEHFRSRIPGELPVEENYPRDKRREDVKRLRPDVLLSNYASSEKEDAPVVDTIPMCPYVGFNSGIELAEHWADLIRSSEKGGWIHDRGLFEKYYA